MGGFRNDGTFDLTWSKARDWHAPACRGPDCWHDDGPTGGEDFLEQLFEKVLKPLGFVRYPIKTTAALRLSGPGLAQKSTDVLFRALRPDSGARPGPQRLAARFPLHRRDDS